MKKVKVLLAALLSVTVVLGTAVPTYAAEPKAEVKIEIEATDMNVSVTVPSVLPIVFNADGTNTFPDNWEIQNVSAIAGIHLTEVALDAESSGWLLLDGEQDVSELKAGTKAVKFYTGNEGALKLVQPTEGTQCKTGSVTFEESELSISSGEKEKLSFQVERGAFKQTQASSKAFNMLLTFDFN